MTELVTIRNVELLEVGVDWQTSTGTFTFTGDDLASAVDAYHDPAVRTPVIKLGHIDPRFDGQFSIGRVENLHLSADGMTLLGDYVGVPKWLAEIMPSAFPRRSVEGAWGGTTQTGNRWPFYLTGVALLGTAYPAISTLQDIRSFYAGEPVDWVDSDGNEVGSVVAASDGAMLVTATQSESVDVPIWRKKVQAAVQVDDVRRAFYDTLTPEQFKWWIRAIRLDPPDLIVDDDEDSIYRMAYTANSDGITFSEPVKVQIVYQDVAASAKQNAHASVPESAAVAVYASRAESRPSTVTASADSEMIPVPEEVSVNEAQKAKLGLPPEATDEDVSKRLDEILNAAVEEPVNPDPGTGAESPEGEPTPATAPAAKPATDPERPAVVEVPAPEGVVIPEGLALVDQATLETWKVAAAKGEQAYEMQRKQQRDQILASAVDAGKIPPARQDHYGRLYDADPDGTTVLLSQLAANTIPVSERGTAPVEEKADTSAYPTEWLSPRERAIATGALTPTSEV